MTGGQKQKCHLTCGREIDQMFPGGVCERIESGHVYKEDGALGGMLQLQRLCCLKLKLNFRRHHSYFIVKHHAYNFTEE